MPTSWILETVSSSTQARAVGADDVGVPVERPLLVPLEGAAAVVVAVDVDEAVALAHLGGAVADEIDTPPGRVAPDLDAVADRFAQLDQVVVHVVDAVVIQHGLDPVDLDELLVCAQAVLHDEQWLLPPVPELVGDDPQPGRVDLPAPVTRLQGGIGHPPEEVAPA